MVNGERIELTQEEVDQRDAEILAAQPEMERQQKLQDIQELEAKITPRRMREALFGAQPSIDFINDIESQITALRTQL